MMGITATVFFLLLCQFGSSTQGCTECECCKNEQQICDLSKNCTYGCKAGYYGENCTGECLENCTTCVNGTECTECKPGYYSVKCNKPCGKGCDNNTCLISGECSCKSTNFINETCENCSVNKYGDECNKTCPSNCSTCISDTECTLCFNSVFYGSHCQNSCSIGCKDGMCNKSNGHCMDECKSGYSGDKCDSCVPGLFGKNCKLNCGKGCVNNTCLISSGECPCKSAYFTKEKCDACSGNKYGDECNKTCPSNCGSCISDTECSWCINTVYYGSYCQYRCSFGCQGGRCNMDGKCSGGCKASFSGDKCDKCSPGLYGNNCDLNCTNNCVTCVFANNCTACKPGFYGKKCTDICPTGCNGNNQSCDWKTGHCLEGCKINYFGSLCYKCPDKCQSNDNIRICDDVNGYCSFGCKDGFHGEKCDKKCGSQCVNETCNQVTADCLHGCTDEYEGLKCVQAIKGAESEEKKPLVVIASSAGAGVAVIVLLVILVICFIKRNRRKKRFSHTQCQENNYVFDLKEIPKSNDEGEPGDIYARPFKPKKQTGDGAGKEYDTAYGDDQKIPAIDNGYTAVNIGTSENEKNKSFQVCNIAYHNKCNNPLRGNNDYAVVNKGKSAVKENECIEEVYDTTHDNKKNKQPLSSNNDYAVLSVRTDNTKGFGKSNLAQPDDVYDSAEGGKHKTMPHPSNDYAVFNSNNEDKHGNDKANTLYDTATDKKMRPGNNDYDFCALDND